MMAKIKEDLTNRVFGDLTVIEYAGNGKWLCECSCENHTLKEVRTSHLTGGYVKSCGHKNGSNKLKDMTGMIIGKLHVDGYAGNSKWNCTCQCNNKIVVRGWELRNEKITECDECRTNIRLDNLSGKTINYWDVLYYLGDKKYRCRCKLCNREFDVFRHNLLNNKSKCCTECANFKKVDDLTDKTFGKLIAKKYIGNSMWECTCTLCNEKTIVNSIKLKQGITKTCSDCWNKLKRIDIKGQIFGDWEVIEYTGNLKWICRCTRCGKVSEVLGYNLRSGHSKSCGCSQLIDITGQTFNELTAIRYLGNSYWMCKCSCGKEVVKHSYELRTYEAKSCGCKKWEYTRNTLLSKYKEIAPCKIGYERTAEQIEALESRESLNKFIESNFSTKPTSYELADKLAITTAPLLRYIHKFGLENKIEVYCSQQESELADIISNIVGEDNIQRRARGIISNNRELDIYIPSKKLAIEFNGNYWHSNIYKSSSYHQDKSLDCYKNNIQLIHIFEYEWNNSEIKLKLIRMINDMLDKTNIKTIYARACVVSEISSIDSYLFLEMNHLQGSAPASVHLGLYNGDELIGVMTFGKPRFNSKYEWELIRLCWKQGTRVIGGADKLFKYFLNKYNPNNIISYCDISKFSGKVYNKLGFESDGLSYPGYKWFKPGINEVISRYQTMKHKLVEQGLGTEDQTEDEIMESLGYIKIYDCGNARYIWSNRSK